MPTPSTSAACPVTDITKIPLFTLGKDRSIASLGCVEPYMVEFDSGLMRSDPKSTPQHRQKPELCNEGKPI